MKRGDEGVEATVDCRVLHQEGATAVDSIRLLWTYPCPRAYARAHMRTQKAKIDSWGGSVRELRPLVRSKVSSLIMCPALARQLPA